MAVLTQTTETYDVSTIRQDLSQAYSSISPEETPFQTLIGTFYARDGDVPRVDRRQPRQRRRC